MQLYITEFRQLFHVHSMSNNVFSLVKESRLFETCKQPVVMFKW